MKYVVEEIQTFDNGTVATPAYSYDTRPSAERQFHLLVANAVVSELPTHAIILMTNEGQQIERKVYHHVTEVEPENPEVTPDVET